MFLNKDRQKFVRGIGLLVILQGLAWFALSVAGIVVKRSPPNSLSSTEMTEYTSYSAYLSRIIYDAVLSDSSSRSRVIRPADFEAFLWIYAVLSAVWVTAALDQNFSIRYKKPRQSYSTLVLGVAVLLTSVIDVVFFSLLARDFSTCPFDLSITTPSPDETDSIRTQIDCQVANGIVMSLAARGYVLWLINVVFGFCLLSIGIKATRTSALFTYGNNTIPRVKVPEPRKAHSPFGSPNPNNELTFLGDGDAFTPPAPHVNGNRNRNNTPVALNNKNQSIYY